MCRGDVAGVQVRRVHYLLPTSILPHTFVPGTRTMEGGEGKEGREGGKFGERDGRRKNGEGKTGNGNEMERIGRGIREKMELEENKSGEREIERGIWGKSWK